MSASHDLDEIQIQILWNRLLSIVEEQAQALIRTAFSTSVREAGDLSAGVLFRLSCVQDFAFHIQGCVVFWWCPSNGVCIKPIITAV